MKQETKETIGPRGTVPGFRPLIGSEKWHREDMPVWMLAGGLRPYLQGEKLRRNDPAWNSVMGEEFVWGITGELPSKHHDWFFATDKPLPPPQVETFEAHGHVWYRHVPGDVCPVESDVVVDCIYETDIKRSFKTCPDPAYNWDWDIDRGFLGYDIIGYRFPDFPAVHTTLQQEQPSAQHLEKTMQSFQDDTTKQRLATMYYGWCDVAPDSVEECIADIAKVLYPTDADRCESAFQKWWLSYREDQRLNLGCKVAWEEAWNAAKKEKQ
ncbi:MAG: hypothetical protein E6Q97_22940 [Desulfurellales bacterium]|nr:MAG: hypothetical protein E6Q97_22940 [Desulfurellales bacterium]